MNHSVYQDLSSLVITSTNPCLLVYMIDQSKSMEEPFGNRNYSKSVEVANAINDILYEVGLRCFDSTQNDLKNRFEVAVIGYGNGNNSVRSAWEGNLQNRWVVSVKDIFSNPLGDVNGKPFWIRPYAVYDTPMTKAFENAYRLCDDWINWGNHRECHPPIIINISDGDATDAGSNFNSLISQVNQLKSLRTNFGNAFLLNIHISSNSGNRVLFPSFIHSSDKLAKLLFELSSPLNNNMLRIARDTGYNVTDGAKGYVFNGNASDLLNFLNIGTPK